MKLLAYADLYSKRLLDDTGGELNLAPITVGEHLAMSLRFYDRIGGQRSERDLDVRAFHATIGHVGRPPESGAFRARIGAAPTTVGNTTAGFMPYNVSAAMFAERLSALPAISAYGACSGVDAGDSTWILTFAGQTGAVPLQGAGLALSPSSFLRVRAFQDNGVWRHEVRLLEAPVASVSIASRVVPPPPTIARIRGGNDLAGARVNEVQALAVPPTFRGTYALKRGDARTAVLDREDGPEEIATALNAMFDDVEVRFLVTNPQRDTAFIEFTGELGAAEQELLEVEIVSAPPGDWTFVLPVDKAEAYEALRDTETDEEMVLEVMAWIAETGAPLEELGRPRELLQVPVTLRRELRWNGLETAAGIDWLRPPEPRTYIPFSPSQTITGQQHHEVAIGDGVAVEYEISHNLGTAGISSVSVRENEAGGRVLVQGTDYELYVESVNVARLVFATPPAEDGVVVVITTAGPTSAFVADIEIEIEQVIGLAAVLSDFGSRIVSLEDLWPSIGASSAASAKPLFFPIPETFGVLHYRIDEEAEPPRLPLEWSAAGVLTTSLPIRAPYLLPAVHDAEVTDPLPTAPLPAAAEGTVWRAAGAVVIPGGGGIRSARVADDEYVASDGRLLYAASRDAATTTYHPRAFEVDLFVAAINDKQLLVGRTAEIVFAVHLQLIHADSKVQWALRIETGTADAEAGPVGLNLEGVTWSETPILEQPIVLTSLLTPHSAGCRIKREVSGLSLDSMLYGNWSANNDAAPAAANFLVRARLTKFDTENSIADARGWVAYRLTGGDGTDDGTGTIGTQKPQITIY